jgi:lipopolysaccharide assembly protein A
MRYVFLIIKLVLFLALFGFALKNDETVVLRYYLGHEWHAPLVIYLFIFFGAGAALGILASLSYIYKRRREISFLKRELRSRSHSGYVAERVTEPPVDAS